MRLLFSSVVSSTLKGFLFCLCLPGFAADVGKYNGDPAKTWDGLALAGIEVRTFEQDNLLNKDQKALRRYLQYVPKNINLKKGKYPLVIVLPGADLSAEVFREWDLGDRVERLAVKEHFIVVYANAYAASGTTTEQHPGEPFWANAGYWRACSGHKGQNEGFFTVDDSQYLRMLIAQVKKEGLPIDADRVYLMGMSNGGEMAQRAARELPDELAGVGAVMPVNGLPANEELLFCKKDEQKPISMMFIYSPKDTLLDWIYPTFGFDYGKVMHDSVASWRKSLGVDTKSEKVQKLPNRIIEGEGYTGQSPSALASINSSILRYDYDEGYKGVSFAVLEINPAGGHAWPNVTPTPFDVASEGHNGFKNRDINAEEVLWGFLKKKNRAAGD